MDLHVVELRGEFSIRGSILDLFPMGSQTPYRIDLFDNEIDSIRTFDPDNQRSINVIEQIQLLPAREFPLDEAAITRFRQNWRIKFAGNPAECPIYQDISQGIYAAGIEYYLPLFYEQTQALLDYLPATSLVITYQIIHQAAATFWKEIKERYEQLRYDIIRPILVPTELFLPPHELFETIAKFSQIITQQEPLISAGNKLNFATSPPPDLKINNKAAQPFAALHQVLNNQAQRILFCAETSGRREALLELLGKADCFPAPYSSWSTFLMETHPLGITVAPLDAGLVLESPAIMVITESQLFGQQVLQQRRRKQSQADNEAIIRNLAELTPGAAVVHIDHGIGRYLGLQTLIVGDIEAEYLMLEYANNDKLYVPVASLHLISRYSGTDLEHAPLHRLGTEHWQKAKRKAAEQVRDIAAELLNIYAQRAARPGYAFATPQEQYLAFAAGFPFEETPDQARAINQVIEDMTSSRAMDRLVCGDVGFGKTEVAMRAAFIAVQENKQVALLVPTTLLAQQHYENFKDRFAEWPIQIEMISRFRNQSEQKAILEKLKSGKIDIIIGTHKLLQQNIAFSALGLVIIDEEHRFGVRQKERLKSLRAEVDILTLTATPIPRTLNMSLSGIRDLSIIATPPARRLSIKMFVREHNNPLIREAILREILRGGQVYFLYNIVESIEKTRRELETLVPEARFAIAHGQMHERELEKVMSDFYHQRFNVLICTTIIETGIDVPSANTIIIDRADKFGLAQLHQLRGRVGRSHHQAYAYLLRPHPKTISADAVKRLDAITSLEDLGAGFTLATHDLEIRGAGELLGESQSGNMQEVGFSLYMELLDRAVAALKSGKEPALDQPPNYGAEIDLQIPALIPDHYIHDVNTRLTLYKRIASVAASIELDELQVEMIDRFGLLPPATKNLFQITELKLLAKPLGIRKIEASSKGGRFEFADNPNIDPKVIIDLIQKQPQFYQLEGPQRLRFLFAKDTTPIERIEAITVLIQKLKGQ